MVDNKIVMDRHSRLRILMREICARAAPRGYIHVRELARINLDRWGLKKSTFQEMLDQFEEAGYIEFDSATQCVMPTEEGWIYAGLRGPSFVLAENNGHNRENESEKIRQHVENNMVEANGV
jgi:DNA-binding PadR family transcriptional regulator